MITQGSGDRVADECANRRSKRDEARIDGVRQNRGRNHRPTVRRPSAHMARRRCLKAANFRMEDPKRRPQGTMRGWPLGGRPARCLFRRRVGSLAKRSVRKENPPRAGLPPTANQGATPAGNSYDSVSDKTLRFQSDNDLRGRVPRQPRRATAPNRSRRRVHNHHLRPTRRPPRPSSQSRWVNGPSFSRSGEPTRRSAAERPGGDSKPIQPIRSLNTDSLLGLVVDIPNVAEIVGSPSPLRNNCAPVKYALYPFPHMSDRRAERPRHLGHLVRPMDHLRKLVKSLVRGLC